MTTPPRTRPPVESAGQGRRPGKRTSTVSRSTSGRWSHLSEVPGLHAPRPIVSARSIAATCRIGVSSFRSPCIIQATGKRGSRYASLVPKSRGFFQGLWIGNRSANRFGIRRSQMSVYRSAPDCPVKGHPPVGKKDGKGGSTVRRGRELYLAKAPSLFSRSRAATSVSSRLQKQNRT